ncbi:MAG: RimK/LysX family protein [Pseudomonadota bacterium]
MDSFSMFRLALSVLCLVIALHSSGPAPAQEPAKAGDVAVAGWVEDGWIGMPPIKLKVKLDTGAKTSSIHAAQYREYERDGKPHVSFTLVNNEGGELKIDAPVIRTASIRRAGAELRERPVIRLSLCVAGVTAETEFTMADRSDLRYPVLVGRSFLAGRILVDAARTFQASTRCKPQE